jgi:hypothetical protein
MSRQPFEDAPGRHPIAVAGAIERMLNRGFDRAVTGRVHSPTPLRQPQHRAPSIGRIV